MNCCAEIVIPKGVRFTRRRWDSYCVAGALLLLAGTAFIVKDPLRTVLAPFVILPLFLMRFQIPAAGYDATPIRALPAPRRRAIWWCGLAGPLLALSAVACVLLQMEWLIWFLLPTAVLPAAGLAFRADATNRRS